MLVTLKHKFRDWAFRRTVDSGTVTLNQRRIYILPTRQGIGFAMVLLLMMIGDINYDLGLGYVLTFLLAMMSILSILYTFRNLAYLQIRTGNITPVFAGELASFQFHFDNLGRLPRYRLCLNDDRENCTVFDLPPKLSTSVFLSIPTNRRGWMDSGRLSLYTEFPLGLFHAWSYLHFNEQALVYPRPATERFIPPQSPQHGQGGGSAAGDEDFSGLRSYVQGDAVPRIAWKALAREQGLQVKQFEAPQGHEMWLEWEALPGSNPEMKLQQLTRGVLDADAQGLPYGLRLPGIELPPQYSSAHRDLCLRTLALFGQESPP